MKDLNYYPRFVLRDVELAGFNCPEQASTMGGGYSGRASALIEEENAGDYQQSPRSINTLSELTVGKKNGSLRYLLGRENITAFWKGWLSYLSRRRK